uniref:26S proteasome non-ATPase regulatory subunit 9 n=1 Tax=Leptobrachium leishanense TaxID=445787 RepID=A0A8C5P770_9ANUR
MDGVLLWCRRTRQGEVFRRVFGCRGRGCGRRRYLGCDTEQGAVQGSDIGRSRCTGAWGGGVPIFADRCVKMISEQFRHKGNLLEAGVSDALLASLFSGGSCLVLAACRACSHVMLLLDTSSVMSDAGVAPESAVFVSDVQRLIDKKDEIEAQIKAYYDVLEDQKGVGMAAPLVDREGYPRADLDIYQVRTARHNIICLQNDHKAIMKEIEEALHSLHAGEKEKRNKDENEAQAEALQDQQTLPDAFAKVDAVTPGSPASSSGLQVGDQIIAFGSVNTSNFQTMQNIASVVQHSEGNPLRVTVVRDRKAVNISLTPQQWSGKGLLGCNIIPLKR